LWASFEMKTAFTSFPRFVQRWKRIRKTNATVVQRWRRIGRKTNCLNATISKVKNPLYLVYLRSAAHRLDPLLCTKGNQRSKSHAIKGGTHVETHLGEVVAVPEPEGLRQQCTPS